MSIAVLAEAGKPVVTRVGFNANQFVLMSGSGNTQYSPFAVINGQVFISDAFIQNGSITNAKLVILSSRITLLRVQQAGALIKMETLNYMANFTLTVASLPLTVKTTRLL